MIFLNAPFLFSWENEHEFLKSAFLIFANNAQCRFLPQFIGRLFSSHVILSIIGCKYKTSSWHLNGFLFGSNIGCCCCCCCLHIKNRSDLCPVPSSLSHSSGQ